MLEGREQVHRPRSRSHEHANGFKQTQRSNLLAIVVVVLVGVLSDSRNSQETHGWQDYSRSLCTRCSVSDNAVQLLIPNDYGSYTQFGSNNDTLIFMA